MLQFEQEAISKDQDIASLNAELEQYVRKYRRLEEYVGDRDKAYDGLVVNNDVLQKENSKLNSARLATEAQIEATKSKLDRIAKEREELAARLRQLKMQNASLSNALSEKSQRLADIELELKQTSDDLVGRLKTLEAIHQEDQERILKGEQLVRSLYTALKQQVNNKGNDSVLMKEYSLRAEEASEAFLKQQSILHEKEGTIASLEGLLQEAVARIASTTRDLSEMERKHEARSEELKNFVEAITLKESELSQLKEMKAEGSKEIATLLAVNNELVLRCNSTTEELDTKSRRIEELEKIHSKAVEMNESALKKLEDYQSANLALREELGIVKSQLVTKNDEVNDLIRTKAEFQRSEESLKLEIDRKSAMISSLDGEVCELRRSHLDISSQLIDSNATVQRRDESIANLNRVMEDLRASFVSKTAEYDRMKAALDSSEFSLSLLRAQKKDVEEQLSLAKKNEDVLSNSLQSAQLQLQDQLNQYSSLKSHTNSLDYQKTQLETTIQGLRETLRVKEGEFRGLHERLHSIEDEKAQLDVSMSSITSLRGADEILISELRTEIDRLRKQCTDNVLLQDLMTKNNDRVVNVLELLCKLIYGRKQSIYDFRNLSKGEIDRISRDLEIYSENTRMLNEVNGQLQDKVDDLCSVLERERNKAYQLEKDIDKARDVLESKSRALEVTEGALHAANDEISALRSSTISLLSEKEEELSKTQGILTDNHRLEADIARLQSTLDKTFAELHSKNLKLSRRKYQLKEQMQEINQLKKDIVDSNNSKDFELQKFREKASINHLEAEALKRDIAELQNSLSLVRNERDLLSERLKAMDASESISQRFIDCQRDLEVTKKRLESVVKDNEYLAEGAIRAGEEIEDLKQKIAALTTHKIVAEETFQEMKLLREQEVRLLEIQDKARQEILDLRRSLESTLSKYSEIESELATERSKAILDKSTLETKLSDSASSANAYRAQLNDLNTKLEALHRENFALAVESQSKTRLEHELTTISSQFELCKRDQIRLQSHCTELSTENSKLSAKALEHEEKLASTEAILSDMREELELLRETVSVLQSERAHQGEERDRAIRSTEVSNLQIEQLELKLSKMELSYFRTTEEFNTVSLLLSNCKKDLELERTSSSQLRDENRRLCLERDSALNSLYHANNENDDLKSALTHAQSTSSGHFAEREQALLSIHRMSTEISELKEQIECANNSLSLADARHLEYKDAYLGLRGLFSDLIASGDDSWLHNHTEAMSLILQYREDADGTLDELSVLRGCNKMLEAEKAASLAMISSTKGESQHLRDSITFLEEVCEKAQSQNEALAIELHALQSQYVELKEENGKFKQRCSWLEARNKELITAESTIKMKCDQLESQLQTAQVDINELRTAKIDAEALIQSLKSETALLMKTQGDLESHQRYVILRSKFISLFS